MKHSTERVEENKFYKWICSLSG